MARKDLSQREAEFLRQMKAGGAPPATNQPSDTVAAPKMAASKVATSKAAASKAAAPTLPTDAPANAGALVRSSIPVPATRPTPTMADAPKSAPGADFQAIAASTPMPAMTARTDPEALLRAARKKTQSARDLVRRRWIIAFGVVIAVLGSWVLFRLVHIALQ